MSSLSPIPPVLGAKSKKSKASVARRARPSKKSPTTHKRNSNVRPTTSSAKKLSPASNDKKHGQNIEQGQAAAEQISNTNGQGKERSKQPEPRVQDKASQSRLSERRKPSSSEEETTSTGVITEDFGNTKTFGAADGRTKTSADFQKEGDVSASISTTQNVDDSGHHHQAPKSKMVTVGARNSIIAGADGDASKTGKRLPQSAKKPVSRGHKILVHHSYQRESSTGLTAVSKPSSGSNTSQTVAERITQRRIGGGAIAVPTDNQGTAIDMPGGNTASSSLDSLVPFPAGGGAATAPPQSASVAAPFSTDAVPPQLPGVKTMADFCSRYKMPGEKRRKRGKRSKDKSTDDGAGGGEEQSKSKRQKKSSSNTDQAGGQQSQLAKVGQTTQVSIGDASNSKSGAPVVEVVNGEIVVRESSLLVDLNNRRSIQEINAELGNEVVEEEGSNLIMTATYNSFVTREKIKHWDVESTKLFYTALRQCGTDFSIMEQFFAGERTRRQLKNKYLLEGRKNPHLIDMALKPTVQTPLDMAVFKVTEEDLKSMPAPAPVVPISSSTDPSDSEIKDSISAPTTVSQDKDMAEEQVSVTSPTEDTPVQASEVPQEGTNDEAPNKVKSALDWMKEIEEEEPPASQRPVEGGAVEDEFAQSSQTEEPSAAATLSLTGRKTTAKKSRAKARVKPKPKGKRGASKKK